MNVEITEDDIDRSHILSKLNNNKARIICRFRNWKIKNRVYSAKRLLKNNPDKIFITEDLTQPRRDLVEKLRQLRKDGKICTYWTADGKIFVKVTNESEKKLIENEGDVQKLVNG